MADKFNFGGRVELIQGGLSEGTGSDGAQFFAKFRNEFQAGVSVAKYVIYLWADVRNVKENPDGSIELDFYGLSQYRVMTYEASDTTTSAVTYTLQVDKENNGSLVQVWTKTTDLSASFDTGDVFVTKGTTAKHYKVDAGHTLTIPELKVAHWLADGAVADDEFNLYIGGKITNTNPANYKPSKIRKGGSWKKLNDNASGKLLIRTSGKWVDKSLENLNTQNQENKGHTRLRRSNKWIQAPLPK